jgi:hypothetical protein
VVVIALTEFSASHRIDQEINRSDEPTVILIVDDKPLVKRMLDVPADNNRSPLQVAFENLPVRPESLFQELASFGNTASLRIAQILALTAAN